MYDYRSRLLHGDIDMAFRHNELNATPEYERFQDDLSKAEALALAMLLATLQEMCRHNKFELNFSMWLTASANVAVNAAARAQRRARRLQSGSYVHCRRDVPACVPLASRKRF